MPLPFIADAALRRAVAGAVGVEPDELAKRYDELIVAANKAAAAEITTALAEKGFTFSQIQQWDRLAEFSRSLGMFFVGIDAAFMTEYSPTWIEFHDRRKELAGMRCLTVGGSLVFPATTTSDGGGTQVTGGDLTGVMPGRNWSNLQL